jgi:hypothetical protein
MMSVFNIIVECGQRKPLRASFFAYHTSRLNTENGMKFVFLTKYLMKYTENELTVRTRTLVSCFNGSIAPDALNGYIGYMKQAKISSCDNASTYCAACRREPAWRQLDAECRHQTNSSAGRRVQHHPLSAACASRSS